MTTAVLFIAWVLIVATVLPFVKHEAWWIRVFDFPRSQITVCAIPCIAALVWLIDPSNVFQAVTLALICGGTAYQAWELSRYTRLRREQSLEHESEEPERRIRLLTANVLMTNRRAGEYLALIRKYDPDVIILAEPDGCWEEQLRAIEAGYPFTIKCPLENTYGMLLYSRLRLRAHEILFRVEEGVPSFKATIELRNGELVELHCLHPRPPHVGVDTDERDAELVIVAKEIANSPLPLIVTGDLNDVAWSHTTRLFLRISGLLDPRLGRTFCNTFHAHYPIFRWPLDHLFHSRSFRLVTLQRTEKTASDHFPVLVELSYEPEVKVEQERPVADSEDLEEAREKVRNVNLRRSYGT
jgi:endonuclease/exonuclease/phosphatase (EEP) superfamily protein YafD